MCVCGGDGDGDDGDEPNVPLPRDLSEHIPLIVTRNIFLCRCNNKYLDIIWKLHCYNLSALLQQLCVEIILLQLLNVVTLLQHIP